MNIRKFIGATSRDALRLVREALGPDAVVLSNRTLEDGTVEIVGVADSDLAAAHSGPAAAPAAAPASRPAAAPSPFGSNPGRAVLKPQSLTALPTKAAPAPAAPVANPGMNPYASGDVFSSVFGATSDESDEHGDDSDDHAPIASSITDESPRTMAESNPWLIEHARRVAQSAALASSAPATRSLTPSVAIAKGLGVPVEKTAAAPAQRPMPMAMPMPMPASMHASMHAPAHAPMDAAPLKVETPDWAREAAQLAARRAALKSAQAAAHSGNPQAAASMQEGAFAGLPASAAQAVTDAIRSRMEQVVNDTVMNELSSMRGMMEEHFAGLLWGDRQRRSPNNAALTKRLFAAGFSAQLVRMVIDNMPEMETAESAMEWVQQVLETNLPVMDSEEAMMERGGVFALMGPTGVGKTTTTAKLAARCVMRFGASKVALLTTDSYRIGAHEQLRIFGKILGVSVHAVKDAADLQLALSELRNKHIVLIDTIGMSQRDRMVSDHISMLCGAGLPVQRLLLLNATSHGDTLNEVVQAYQSAPDQPPLAGCILTKLDEATNLGGVIDTVIRYKLPVHYVSTGQKVPENLYVATKRFLIKSAFCIPRDGSPFVPQDEEVPALLSALSARAATELHEVHFG